VVRLNEERKKKKGRVYFVGYNEKNARTRQTETRTKGRMNEEKKEVKVDKYT
jgi:hypothetical protein